MEITLNILLNRLTSEQLIKTLTTRELRIITGNETIENCFYDSFDDNSLKFKFKTEYKKNEIGFITSDTIYIWIGNNGEIKGEIK